VKRNLKKRVELEEARRNCTDGTDFLTDERILKDNNDEEDVVGGKRKHEAANSPRRWNWNVAK
jgi:hypothetical protein